jgi:hypothetical protein
MIRTVAAFSAGVVVGWVGRGVLGSERELLVRTIGLAQAMRERASRLAAEQVEWWQDLVAEAKARRELRRANAHPDEDARAKVVRVA